MEDGGSKRNKRETVDEREGKERGITKRELQRGVLKRDNEEREMKDKR